jgi:hypothetical protein
MRRRTGRAPALTLGLAGVVCLVLGSASGGLAAAALTGKDVKDHSLTGADFKKSSLAVTDFRPGVTGPRGAAGPPGATGAAAVNAGYTLRFDVGQLDVQVGPGQTTAPVTLTCPAGSTALGATARTDVPMLINSVPTSNGQGWTQTFRNDTLGTQHLTPLIWCTS